jgi:hypothetical protein
MWRWLCRGCNGCPDGASRFLAGGFLAGCAGGVVFRLTRFRVCTGWRCPLSAILDGSTQILHLRTVIAVLALPNSHFRLLPHHPPHAPPLAKTPNSSLWPAHSSHFSHFPLSS